MAAAFVAFGIWALWVTRRPRRFLAFAGVFLSVLVWWLCIRPSHDRHWRPEVAVMPRAIVDGDRVRIMGCRNFEYRSRDDFTVRYDERVLTRASSQHERGMECGKKDARSPVRAVFFRSKLFSAWQTTRPSRY
jgi:hypothetical protein